MDLAPFLARDIQLARFHGRKIFCNVQMSARDLKQCCATERAAEQLRERAMAKLGLSGRAYARILKVARTIADLDCAPEKLSAVARRARAVTGRRFVTFGPALRLPLASAQSSSVVDARNDPSNRWLIAPRTHHGTADYLSATMHASLDRAFKT